MNEHIEAVASFKIPKQAAVMSIVQMWEDRVPGWRRTSADFRCASNLWKDCGQDLKTVGEVLDEGIRRCESDPFWARNRTLRFVASRVDELLNCGREEDRGAEREHARWVRDVGIFQFRLADRERTVRLGRELLGSYERLRAVLASAPARATDADLIALFERAAERTDGPRGNDDRPGGRHLGPGDPPG